MYNYEKFQRDCRLIFSGSYRWHACVEFKHFDILYRKQQNSPALSLKQIAKLNCK